MPIALRTIRDRIRERLRDTDARQPTYVSPQIDAAIASAYLGIASLLPAPDLYTASAFTISAGASTFTLPGTVTGWTGGDGQAEYRGDVRIQLASTGEYLHKVTMDEMDAIRDGSVTIAQGIPDRFALYEDKTQAVNGRCYPAAQSAEVCHLYAKLEADDLRNYVGAGTDDMDDVEVQFSRIAALALELYAAAELVDRMVEDDLKLRRLNPKVTTGWRKEANGLIYSEAGRRYDLASSGRTQRWLS